MVKVEYRGGALEEYVPSAGITFARGEIVDVPDDVAGREPGGWHPLPADTDVPDGWHTYRNDAGITMVQDPGDGLLAQSDKFARITDDTNGGEA